MPTTGPGCKTGAAVVDESSAIIVGTFLVDIIEGRVVATVAASL